jgi:hypothetical protein
MEEAYVAEFGVKQALNWAEGFMFPREVHTRNWKELERCGFSLSRLTRSSITVDSKR